MVSPKVKIVLKIIVPVVIVHSFTYQTRFGQNYKKSVILKGANPQEYILEVLFIIVGIK